MVEGWDYTSDEIKYKLLYWCCSVKIVSCVVAHVCLFCFFFFFFFLFFFFSFFFFNDTATTEIYTLSLHDALPIFPYFLFFTFYFFWSMYLITVHYLIYLDIWKFGHNKSYKYQIGRAHVWTPVTVNNLVCRLLLEKKKKKKHTHTHTNTKQHKHTKHE